MDRIISPNRKVIMPNRRVRHNSLGQMVDQLNSGPSTLEWPDVPVDLHERPVQEYNVKGGRGVGAGFDKDALLNQIARDVNMIASTLVLDRGLIGRVVNITVTPQLILDAQYLRGYLLLNPASVVGLTAVGTLFVSTSLVGATTLASLVLGVANYNTLRLFLRVTAFAGPGPVTFDAQTLDPVDTITFITSQTAFSITATGDSYADLGGFGVDTDFRIFVTVPAATTITFTLGFASKDGLEGTSTGIAQTIFLGSAGVHNSVGFPLLSGKEKAFYLRENTKLFAVTAGATLPMRIFEL